jgi:hypothetical protein
MIGADDNWAMLSAGGSVRHTDISPMSSTLNMHFVGLVALAFYGISEKLNFQRQVELAERRESLSGSIP